VLSNASTNSSTSTANAWHGILDNYGINIPTRKGSTNRC
jgi:hypothetical protein